MAMTYRPLGRCGTKVSVLGLGGWTTYGSSLKDESTIAAILKAAYSAGINLFDIADSYGNGEAERLMGKALKEFPRHTLVISTKLFFPMSEDVNDKGLSRKHIMESVERSLKNIGTDYLDLYFCHRFDPETPLEETARAMDDLIRQGKILYWGTSEWSGLQLRETARLCDQRNLCRPQVEQPQMSLRVRHAFEGDVQPEAEKLGMGLLIWSPLSAGLLSGKYDDGIPAGSRLSEIGWLKDIVLTEANIEKVRRLKPIAESLRCSRAQLALAWAAGRPGVSSLLTGATRLDQLKENLGSLAVEIPADIRREVEALFPLFPRE